MCVRQCDLVAVFDRNLEEVLAGLRVGDDECLPGGCRRNDGCCGSDDREYGDGESQRVSRSTVNPVV